MVRADDLPAIKSAKELAGFHHRETAGLDMFVEHPDASARDAVRLVIAGVMVRGDDVEPNPQVEPTERAGEFQTLPLQDLVRMKLNSFRRKDQVHLLDMISMGLIDDSWLTRFPAVLSHRLKELLDEPDG